MLSRFDTIPGRDGQTDGQTDVRTDGLTALLYQYRASKLFLCYSIAYHHNGAL